MKNKVMAILDSGLADRINLIEKCIDNYDLSQVDFYWLISDYSWSLNSKLEECFNVTGLNIINFGRQDISTLPKSEYEIVLDDFGGYIFGKKEVKFTNNLSIKQEIKEHAQSLVPDIDKRIGVHLRAYEGSITFRSKNEKPTIRDDEGLEHLYNSFMKHYKTYEQYFVATDSEYLNMKLNEKDNIVIIDKKYNNGYFSRNATDSFKATILDLYLLSMTKSTIITYGGFGMLATRLGKKQHIRII